MKLLRFVGFFALPLLFSCSESNKNEFTLYLDGENAEINTNTLISDSTGNRYCSIDTSSVFGYGWKGLLSKDLEGRDLKIVFSCRSKFDLETKGSLVFQFDDSSKDSTVLWKECPLDLYTNKLNQWTEVKDSIIINKTELIGSPIRFGVFPFKVKGAGKLYTDNLLIKISAL